MARFEPNDQQWQQIEALLPPEHSGKRGRPYRPHRPVVNGILWILTTGARWCDLPAHYGPWQTAYDRFVRWRKSGVWDKVLGSLQAYYDETGRLEWHFGAGDSTIIAVHPIAATRGHVAQEDAKKGGLKRTIRLPTSSKTKLSDVVGADRRPRST
jgi:transposase